MKSIRWVSLASALALVACSEDLPETAVVVNLDADEAMRARVAKVEVTVAGGAGAGGFSTSLQREFRTDGEAWPLRTAIAPIDGELGRRFSYEATAFDETDAVVGRVRVTAGFVDGEVVETQLLLVEACVSVHSSCGFDETCRSGACVSAETTLGGESPDGGVPVSDGCAERTCFPDDDGDGFSPGGPEAKSCDCLALGMTETDPSVALDCDDTDSAIAPRVGADVCDGTVDNDCDGAVDEDCACANGEVVTCGTDEGECSSGEHACTNGAWPSDCPGSLAPAAERCNGVDDDCDGSTDEGLDFRSYYRDGDDDGFGCGDQCAGGPVAMTGCAAPVGFVADGADCDDGSSSINPMGVEECDGTDWNCDGNSEPTGGCACTNGQTMPCGMTGGACTAGVRTCTGGSWGECIGVVGGGTEICDGISNDCDDLVDEGATSMLWRDADGDGRGDPTTGTQRCEASGWVNNSLDCSDRNRHVANDCSDVARVETVSYRCTSDQFDGFASDPVIDFTADVSCPVGYDAVSCGFMKPAVLPSFETNRVMFDASRDRGRCEWSVACGNATSATHSSEVTATCRPHTY